MRITRLNVVSLAHRIALVALAGSLVHPAVSAAATPDATSVRLQSLARDMTFGWAKTHPLVATELGIAGEDGELDMPSEAATATDLATIRRWQAELAAIPLDGASLVDRDDAKLLRAQLTSDERTITVYARYRKSYGEPAGRIVDAIFTQFQHLPIPGTGGATETDRRRAWADITSRLERAPAYIAAGEALVTTPGRLYGTVGAQELAGAPDFMRGALTDTAKAQLPPDDLARFTAARDGALAAIAAAKAYIDAHAASWPENYAMGRAAYDAMLHDEQLLPYDASAIEQMARDELAHGWAQRAWVENDAKQRGTPIGYESGGGLAPGGAALVGYYRDRIAQLRSFVTTNEVVDVPSWLGKIDVVETPKFLQPVSPGASMNPPLPFGKDSTGFYYITPPTSLADAARRLDPNQDFDKDRILSTGAHEAMPGHFVQFSIAYRHPDFVRKIQSSDVFAEGWAYYGEEMLWQVGLYGDADLDARYYNAQWERVRGARAIVDGKLASGEWTFDRATAFFAEQTGFPPDEAKATVSGIALGPGYVISYTVGRLQLESLLSDYLLRAGAKASLRDFHDRLLCYGTTPFAVVAPELLGDLDKPLAEVRAAANY